MRSKGYSQSISVIASAFFGTSVRNFDDFHQNLALMVSGGRPPTSNDEFLATAAAVSFFLMLFHVIHGINSYDAWASTPQGRSSNQTIRFGKTTKVVAIVTQPVAALLFPFLIFHVIASNRVVAVSSQEICASCALSICAIGVAVVWIGLFGVFAVWDLLLFLHAPQDKIDPSYHKTITNWLLCDSWGMLSFLVVFTISTVMKCPLPAQGIFIAFIISALGFVGLDYVLNSEYFFDHDDQHSLPTKSDAQSNG